MRLSTGRPEARKAHLFACLPQSGLVCRSKSSKAPYLWFVAATSLLVFSAALGSPSRCPLIGVAILPSAAPANRTVEQPSRFLSFLRGRVLSPALLLTASLRAGARPPAGGDVAQEAASSPLESILSVTNLSCTGASPRAFEQPRLFSSRSKGSVLAPQISCPRASRMSLRLALDPRRALASRCLWRPAKMWGPTRVGAEEEKGTEETPALTGACARRAASSACLAFQVEGRHASRANARCFPVGLPEKKIGPCIQAAGQQGTAEGSVSPGGCLAVPALSPGSPSNAPPAEDVANRGVTPQSEGDLREPALAAPSFPLSRAVDLAYQEVFPTLHHASLSSGPSLLSPASPSGSASPPGASPVASRGARRAPLVLVLHGMFRCGDDMLELCSQLHAERVLAVDLRNHGASPFTSSMFLQDMAADVIALIQRELGLSRPRGAGPGPAGTEGELDERGGRPARGGFRDAEASSLRAAEEFPGCEAEPSQARSCGMQARPSRARAAPPHHSASSTAPVASSGCPPRPSVWQRPRGCTVVGHSLGGQVALAAALRAPAGLISGVVALDICPVNYYDWPLPRAGPYDIRDLVELVAAPLLVGDGSKQKALERLGEVAPALKGAGARSLLCLLAEEEVPANRDEEEETCCPQDHARSEERGERGCDSADGGSATQRSHEADGRIQENVTPHGGEEGERACCAPLHSGQAERRVKSPWRSYKTVKKLRWKMNTPVLRDSFRNKTLRWDLPAALSSAQAAPALSSQPHSSSDSLPLTPSTAFSAVPGGVRRPSPSSSAPPTSREAHAAVESFHKPPSPYTGPVLIVRGLCSPWVDPARHWSAIKNYFPAARGLTLESAGHAVHVDQPQETAEAINALLHEVVADA